MKKKKKEKKRNFYDEIFCMTIAILFIPALVLLVVYYWDVTDTASHLGLVNANNSKEWRSAIIEYSGMLSGAFVGLSGSLIVALLTTKKQAEFRKEDNRIRSLPLLKVEGEAEIDWKNPKNTGHGVKIPVNLNLTIQNVGEREMYELWTDEPKRVRAVIYKNNTIQINIRVVKEYTERELRTINIKMFFYYRDCYENWYSQEMLIFGDVDDPEVEIASAPTLVCKESLPEKIKTSKCDIM